jgi:hypothetical protein
MFLISLAMASYCGGGVIEMNFTKYFAILLPSEVNEGYNFNLVSGSFVDFLRPLKLYKYQHPFAWAQARICCGREKNIRFLLGRLL